MKRFPESCEPSRESLNPRRGSWEPGLTAGRSEAQLTAWTRDWCVRWGSPVGWGLNVRGRADPRQTACTGRAALTPSCRRPCCRTGLCRWPARSPEPPPRSSPVCCGPQLWEKANQGSRGADCSFPVCQVGRRQGCQGWEARWGWTPGLAPEDTAIWVPPRSPGKPRLWGQTSAAASTTDTGPHLAGHQAWARYLGQRLSHH